MDIDLFISDLFAMLYNFLKSYAFNNSTFAYNRFCNLSSLSLSIFLLLFMFIIYNPTSSMVLLNYRAISPSEHFITLIAESLHQSLYFFTLFHYSMVPLKFTSCKLVHPQNAPLNIAFKPLGKLICINLVQPLNASK